MSDKIENTEDEKHLKGKNDNSFDVEAYSSGTSINLSSDNIDFSDLDKLHDELTEESKKHYLNGRNVTLLAIVFFFAIYYFSNFYFIPTEGEQVMLLAKEGCKTTGLVIFYLVSKLILASFMTVVFVQIFRISIGGYSQSVRFKKRLQSAFIMKFLYKVEKIGPITTKERIDFYRAWTETIESAYDINSNNDDRSMSQKILDKLNSLRTVKIKDIEVETQESKSPTV